MHAGILSWALLCGALYKCIRTKNYDGYAASYTFEFYWVEVKEY